MEPFGYKKRCMVIRDALYEMFLKFYNQNVGLNDEAFAIYPKRDK